MTSKHTDSEKQLSFDDITTDNKSGHTGSKAGKVFFIIILILSLCANVYFLYTSTHSHNEKSDIEAYCLKCGSYTTIHYDHNNDRYTKLCNTCVRESSDTYTTYDYDYDYDNEYDSNDNDTYTGGTVCVTRTGDKYHQIWCRYVSGKTDLTYYDSKTAAEAAGYDACSVCY